MNTQPLADRMRPTDFDTICGQEHLVGKNGIIRRLVENGRIPNMIFYGPPGIGKTTVANIIAKAADMQIFHLNATTASLADVKEVLSGSKSLFASNGTLLYLDEIQYFNKKQQQSLLESMEDGHVTLIAATTENPYYCVYKALLSRSSVFAFEPVTPKDILPCLRRALDALNKDFGEQKTADDSLLLSMAYSAGGDVRMAIGLLENAYYISADIILPKTVEQLSPNVIGHYDRDGDVHYDLLSCLQKSIRGSDPDAAVFYLARLLACGDLTSICRRLLVIASEDVGAAWPLAPILTHACTEAAKEVGLPEAAIPLANAAVQLATAPKSNTAYLALHAATEDLEAGKGLSIPEHLHSPLFQGYLYPHDYENDYVTQTYLPADLAGSHYYVFGSNKTEQAAKAYYDMIRSHPSVKKTSE